ncbi:Outer membrane efflux protein BepC precursor [Salinivirga cyanobacteriivorans]|uniref:Outer membrane efflux protein BepC n=1 Tax=Salinivirga cyanobacteriivorans TaxID=1307839 RepID=A0A0S2I165_9BACT|nr:TolC family protein [Salinivirga cyanobacteriivorans]ALO15893.1 Outer membrane efflux protein BepC precursor [Salinivirga cyanobacteriivorans]
MVISKKYVYFCTLIAVFIWIGGSGPALGQEPLSFFNAISKTLENNYQIRIAQKDLEIAANNNTAGAAGMWPSITLSAAQNNRWTDQTKPQSSTTLYNDISPSVNLNWMLFGGFSVQINRSRLAELENLSEGMMSVVVENTLQAIILAYQKTLLEKERLQITREVMNLSLDQFRYAKTQKNTGNGTTFDLQQAKTAYLEDSSNYILQGINFRNAKRNLNLIMGESHTKQYTLTDSFQPIDESFNLEELYNRLEASNQTLTNQYINQKLIKYDLQQSKSNLYPTFSLNAGSSYTYGTRKVDDLPNTNSDPLVVYGNFTLNFNLFNGGQVKRSIQNAKISLEQSKLETREMENELKMQLVSLYDLYNVRKQLYNVALENEKVTQLNYELAKDRYRLGTINSINFRQVQLSFLNASLSKLQTIYDLMDSYTEIMRMTGNILTEFDPQKQQ